MTKDSGRSGPYDSHFAVVSSVPSFASHLMGYEASAEDLNAPPGSTTGAGVDPSFTRSDGGLKTYSRRERDGNATLQPVGDALATVVSAFSAETNYPWWMADDSNYLCVSVREAKGIVAVDHSCMSTSS